MDNTISARNSERGFRLMAAIGRVALLLAVLALIGAWISGATGGILFGWSQQHLFNDATVLALLGIGFLVDGFIHRQGV